MQTCHSPSHRSSSPLSGRNKLNCYSMISRIVVWFAVFCAGLLEIVKSQTYAGVAINGIDFRFFATFEANVNATDGYLDFYWKEADSTQNPDYSASVSLVNENPSAPATETCQIEYLGVKSTISYTSVAGTFYDTVSKFRLKACAILVTTRLNVKIEVTRPGPTLIALAKDQDVTFVFRPNAFVPTFFGTESSLSEPSGTVNLLYTMSKNFNSDGDNLDITLVNIATANQFKCVANFSTPVEVSINKVVAGFELQQDGGLTNPHILANMWVIQCSLDETIQQGNYNLRINHRQYGLMRFSTYGFAQMTVNDGVQLKYMIKIIRRVYDIGQHVISYLGGYMKISGFNITLEGNPDIYYEGRKCEIVSLLNADQILCYLSNLNQPTKRAIYAGNAGVTYSEAECTSSEYELMALSYTPWDPMVFPPKIISSFTKLDFYNNAKCVRAQAILKTPVSMEFQLGAGCMPGFCSLRISQNGLDNQGAMINRIKVELPELSSIKDYLSNYDSFMTSNLPFYSENDYLVDFVRYISGNFLPQLQLKKNSSSMDSCCGHSSIRCSTTIMTWELSGRPSRNLLFLVCLR